MTNPDFIERVILANGYHKKYSSFDEFWDKQIAHSYVVAEGPAPEPLNADEARRASAKSKSAARAVLEHKYWPEGS